MYDLDFYRQQLSQANWHSQGDTLLPEIREWLLHRGSLTEKLQTICETLQVEIIQEGWQAVDFTENSAKHWLREVWLKGDGQAWIYAQTLLPEITMSNVARDMLTLGEKPVGLWLFPQQPVRACLGWQQDRESGLYSRYSKLLLRGYPIEIKELFLPNFPFGH